MTTNKNGLSGIKWSRDADKNVMWAQKVKLVTPNTLRELNISKTSVDRLF